MAEINGPGDSSRESPSQQQSFGLPGMATASVEASAEGAEVLSVPDPLHSRDFVAHEFLLWLWYRSEREFGAFNLPDGPTDLWFDDKLTFLAQDEKRIVSSFNGGAPSTTPEAKLSILSGKVISEAKLGLRRGENEWSFLLRVRGGELQLHGLKVPAILKEGAEEMIYERMYLVDVVNIALQSLFERFFRERIDERWKTEIVPDMSRWLMGDG